MVDEGRRDFFQYVADSTREIFGGLTRGYHNFREFFVYDFRGKRRELEAQVQNKENVILNLRGRLAEEIKRSDAEVATVRKEMVETATKLGARIQEVEAGANAKIADYDNRARVAEAREKDYAGKWQLAEEKYRLAEARHADEISTYEVTVAEMRKQQELEVGGLRTQVGANEERVAALRGLLAWRDYKIDELRTEWFGAFRSLVGRVFADEPYVFVDSKGIIAEVSKKAQVFFRYEDNVLGRSYLRFLNKKTREKGISLGEEFATCGRDEAHLESILVRVPGRKKVKVNASVFPCCGPRDARGRETYAGYIVLFDRPSMGLFRKGRALRESWKQVMDGSNSFFRDLDKKLQAGREEGIEGTKA